MHGPGPCPVCDNKGPMQPGDLEHILEVLLEEGWLEETEPGRYRVRDDRVAEAVAFLKGRTLNLE